MIERGIFRKVFEVIAPKYVIQMRKLFYLNELEKFNDAKTESLALRRRLRWPVFEILQSYATDDLVYGSFS